ncbi:M14 family zinc carboxypeptidase, partial [Algibacter luteus]
MKKITLLGLMLILIAQFSFSQNLNQTAKRIAVPNPSTTTLQNIQKAGIDLSCGPKFVNNNLVMELSDSELKVLQKNGITYNVLIDDLYQYYEERNAIELPKAQAALQAEKLKTIQNRALAAKTLSKKSSLIDNPAQHDDCDEIDWATPTNFKLGASFGGALTLSEAYAELDLMRTLYPNLISVRTDASPTNQTTHGNSTGGTTWSGQTVYYVRISDNPDIDEPNEPETLITGAMHAREISSVMNTFYFMWYILENYSTDPFIKNIVDNHEIYVMPISNPDGYRWNEVIAPGGNGLQRKNLRPGVADNGTTDLNNNVRGVDLNRNFNYYWGWDNTGSSGTTSSNTYRGPSAGSEPETQIVQDFITSHDIKVAVNHHGGLNSIVTSSYNGESTAADSGREDEYAKICHDLTQYNRYIYGSAPNTLYEANGDINDWMLGGPSVTSGTPSQTSSGSGKDVLAFAPENGDDFWPSTTLITEISRRAMRMNFLSVLYSGKFAKFHDLNTSDISNTSGNFTFGIEYLGKTYNDITLTVTPVSSNITSLTSPAVQTGWSKLEQRNLTVPYTLDASIQPNDEIEFQITLSNNDFIIYRANYVKYFQQDVLFQDNDTNISNWTASGGSWGTTGDSYIGSVAITDSPSGAYTNNENKTLTLNSSIDLSSSSHSLVQFYAKWDLERNYDMVQFEASIDGGTNWSALCGKYNKPAATSLTNFHLNKTTDTHQSSNGNTVYDGDSMDKWVMEEILINNDDNSFLTGQSNVQFRFRFKTDSSNREDDLTTTFDGFIFDDFKILSFPIPCDNTNPPANITADTTTTALSAIIDWDNIPSATYDLKYRVIGAPSWTEYTNITTNTYTINSLVDGTNYEVQVRTRCNIATSVYSASINFTATNPPPCSGTLISTFPYNESFENSLGDWTQDTGDNFNWSFGTTSGTPSGSTGPSGPSDGTYFLYTEADNGGDFQTAIINSPCFNLTNQTNAMFSFDYHMYGSQLGSISLEASTNDGSSWVEIQRFDGEQQTSSSAAWKTHTEDLSAYEGGYVRLRIIGTLGNINGQARSDIGIDKIGLTSTNGVTTWYQDLDSDTYGNPAVSQVAASQPVGYVADNTDCDDTDANINPTTVWYLGVDNDSDGYFGSQLTATQCTNPGGYSTTAPTIDDCDDT